MLLSCNLSHSSFILWSPLLHLHCIVVIGGMAVRLVSVAMWSRMARMSSQLIERTLRSIFWECAKGYLHSRLIRRVRGMAWEIPYWRSCHFTSEGLLMKQWFHALHVRSDVDCGDNSQRLQNEFDDHPTRLRGSGPLSEHRVAVNAHHVLHPLPSLHINCYNLIYRDSLIFAIHIQPRFRSLPIAAEGFRKPWPHISGAIVVCGSPAFRVRVFAMPF